MSESIIAKIDNAGLCLGCGFCEAVLGKENGEMRLGQDGFFHPQQKIRDRNKEKVIQNVCPSLNVVHNGKLKKDERIWGRIVGLYEGFSTDAAVRTKSSSGGIISALAIHLLENGKVDAVLQVGGDINDYTKNSLKVSKTREEVIQNSSSRYAPALVFNKIIALLEQSSDSYCFIGKPCDIAALQNFIRLYPQYKERFKVTISIVCAGMPNFKGTERLINNFKPEYPVTDLLYRGNGWPGYFSFKDKNHVDYKTTYGDSWGKVLNKHLAFRCKICPEGIGMLADIAVGDAWETEDGYPDFTEKEGSSLIITRTSVGQTLLTEAVYSNDIVCKKLEVEKLRFIQPYQYNRRKRVGVRIMAATLAKRITFNFRQLSIYTNFLQVSPKILAKEFYGTFKRARKRSNP